MQKRLRPAIKSHGGKFYLAPWIVDNLPEDYTKLHYCEPFCAGASVFFQKQCSASEVLSDIDSGVVSILKALRDEPKEFIARISRTKYTERTFKMAQKRAGQPANDYIDEAVTQFVVRRMSRGGMSKAFAWSERKRGGQPGDVNAWKTIIKQLPALSERLQGVSILCANFKEVIPTWDEANCLFYLDPPYLHSTRTEGSTNVYAKEMTVEEHVHLLHLIKDARGKVIVSGYSSPLYNRYLKNWRCKKKNVINHASQAKVKERRIEVLWFNY